MGANGNCCLGASRDAKSFCAIKFYHKSAQIKENIEAECNNWKNIYKKEKFHVRMLNVAGGYCLFMPYMMPIAKNERAGLLYDGSIRNTLTDFAERKFRHWKFRHSDIKWRHFRRWKGNIYLIDLGAVEKIRQEESSDFWVEQQIQLLENDMKNNSNKKSRTDSQGTDSQSTDSQSTETSMESTEIV